MNTRLWLIALGTMQALGCAHSSPPERLVDARVAYERAANVPAPETTLRSEQLRQANIALLQAEYVFEQEGDSEQVRELSSLALKRSRLAELDARRAERDARRAEAETRRDEPDERQPEAEPRRHRRRR